MENSYIIAILFTFSCLSGGIDGMLCSKGEKLITTSEGEDFCIMCDQGTFMDEENHSLRTCKPCTKIENSEVEVHVRACNRTHDAEILCTSGFYRRRARNARQTDRCEKCTECLFPARNCEGYYDTVCCPPDQDAVMSPSGVFVCKKRPIVCGPGQFFNSRTEECTPCPDRTFMSAHNHTYNHCLKCEELSGNNDSHAVIVRPCSRTAPTLFGCEEGYFRDPIQESTQTEVSCTPRQNCSPSLLDCGMFHDAVCDVEDLTAATDKVTPTNSTGIGHVEDVTTRLMSLLPGIRGSCVRQCLEHGDGTTKTSVAQSESNARKCLEGCLFEIDKPYMASAWLRAVFCIILSIFFTFIGYRLSKNLATCNFGKICLNRSQFTRGLFIFNVFNSCLFILNACLETKIIENDGYFLITNSVCYILLIVNVPLVLIFVTKSRPKNRRKRNGSKDAQTRHNHNTEETKQFVAPPEKSKERSAFRKLQHDESLSDVTSC